MEVFSLFGTLGLRGASDVKAQLQETSKQADNTAKTFDNSTERTGKSSQSLLAKIGAGFTQAGNVAGQFVAGSIRAIGNFGQSLENQGQKMINFGGGAKTALATVGLSVGTLAMSITAGMKRLDALNGANLVFQSMGAAADTSFGGISKAAKDMTKGTVMSVGDFNSKVQQYIAKGVPQAAAIATTALNAFVKGTSVGMTDAATATARFNSVGMDLNKSTTEFKNMTKVLAGTGNATAAGIDAASLAISQMAGKGKLDMGNMLQLMNTMPNALAFVSQSTGISMKDIQQAISDGKVSYEDFSKALQDQSVKVDEQFAKQGGVMAQTGKTFEGSISNMKAAVARFGASILEGIGQSKITDAMANISSKIDETAAKITPIIPKVVDFGTKLFNLAQKFAPVIGAFLAFKLGALGVGTVMKQVGSVFTTFAKNPILSIIMLLVAAFVQAYTHSETFRKAIQDLFSAIQNSGAMELLKIAFERISTVVGQVKDSVSKLWDNISKGTNTSNIIQTIVGFFNNLGLAVYDVVDFVIKLWESLQNSGALDSFKNAFKNTFSIISSLVSPIIDLVKNLWDKISEAGTQQSVIETLDSAFSTVGSTIESVTGFVKGLVDWFKQGGTGVDVLKAAFVGLGTILGGYAVYQGILKGIALAQQAWAIATGVWSAVTSGATAIQMAFNAAIAANPIGMIVIAIMAVVAALIYFFTQTTAGKQIWQDFINWIKNAWQGISSFFSGLWSGIVQIFNTTVTAIHDFVVPIFNTIASGIQIAMNLIWSVIQIVWQAIKVTFELVVGGIVAYIKWAGEVWLSIITTAMNLISNVIMTVWNAIQPFVMAVVNAIKDVITTVWNTIVSVITTVMTTIGNVISTVWNGIWGFLQPILSAIANFFSSVWNGITSAVSSAVHAISSVISSVWNGIWGFLQPILSAIGNFISSVWNGIMSTISSVVNSILSVVSNVWNAVSSTTSSVFNTVSSIASSVWNGISSTISSVVNSIQSVVSSVWNSISNVVSSVSSGISGTVSSIWNGLTGIVSGAMNGVMSTVSGILDKIKGFFNFNLSFPKIDIPHIPLPHFSISGDFNPLKGKIPSIGVDWYAKGGILNSPTIFGMNGNNLQVGGEAGREAVLPLNKDTLGGIGRGISETMQSDQQAILDKLDELIEILSLLGFDFDIRLDDGTLVGKLADKMDRAIYDNSRRKQRGRTT
ncbi:Phage tail length tape-measure protein [Lactococcus lactis subsp. lactis Dephy 1]|uniref:tape measure protein n=1 Tax=Lactococcus lactis TaxID=1358 RepID=UPI0003B8060F|nr:tape measure protein [Lactococcus lactis]CDI47508.1 Phage tail length tape-measure protein [Lactococcus lactis subsp. lactis Dephy 1]